MSSITLTCLEYWKRLLIELSATPFPLQSILSTAIRGSDLFRTEIQSGSTSLQMCSYLAQSSCHYPHIGPQDPAWSDPGHHSALLYVAQPNWPPCYFSITPHQALPQGHCTHHCSAWNVHYLLCSTSHHIFSMVEAESLVPTPSVHPMLPSIILFCCPSVPSFLTAEP